MGGGKWGFEGEIDHLGDNCDNLCVLGSSGDDEIWLDSVLKLKTTGFADKK